MTRNERLDIRAFVEKQLADNDDHAAFGDAESLLGTGRLDSLAVVKLVTFLESEFDVDFGEIEFDPTRFDSVDELLSIVEEARGRS